MGTGNCKKILQQARICYICWPKVMPKKLSNSSWLNLAYGGLQYGTDKYYRYQCSMFTIVFLDVQVCSEKCLIRILC